MAFLRSTPGKITLAVVILAALLFAEQWVNYLSVLKVGRTTPYAFPIRVAMLAGIAIILAVSLNLVNGVTGQFSIGHAGFMAVGAYAAAALTVYGQHLGWFPRLSSVETAPVWKHLALGASLLVGGAAAAAAGWVVGQPSLRLKGDYLAIVTLGFGEIIRVAILNIDAVGGSSGFSGYASPTAGRITIPQLTGFTWVFMTVVVVVFFYRNLLRSNEGLRFFSVREDEVAAEAMGVNTTRVKVPAFVISAFFAGVAGGLYAHYDTYLKPDCFNFLRSIEIITMVVLGGMGSITGSILGAIVLTSMPELLRIWLPELKKSSPQLLEKVSTDLVRQLLYALLLVVLMLTRPQGLFGTREISLLGRFRKPSPPAPAPDPT